MRVTSRDLNPSGQLVGFRYHDATLVGFRYDDKAAQIAVQMRREDGTVGTLRCNGVSTVGAIGLRFPGIVSEIMAWHPQRTPDGAATMLDGSWSVLFGGDISLENLPEAIRDEIRRNPHEYLVHIACSYGGAIATLRDEIYVFEGSEGPVS